MTDDTPNLSIVPEVGDPDLVPAEEAMEEAEVSEETIDAVFEALEEQNAALVNRLSILGKGVNPLMLLKIQLDTLVDFVMGDTTDAPRKQYEAACSLRLNETLKLTLAQLIGASVE